MPSLDEEKAKQDPSYYLKNTNTETRETLQELYKEFKGDEMLAATMRVPEKAKVDKLNAVSRGPAPLPWQHSWSAVLGGGLPAASVVPCHRAAWGVGRHGPAELATQSQSDPGVPSCRGRAAGGPGVPAAWPSPACPTPVLVLGPGSPSAVRALGLMPWPLGPSAAPAPYQGGPGDWGWETPFKQLSRKAGVLKTRVCCS